MLSMLPFCEYVRPTSRRMRAEVLTQPFHILSGNYIGGRHGKKREKRTEGLLQLEYEGMIVYDADGGYALDLPRNNIAGPLDFIENPSERGFRLRPEYALERVLKILGRNLAAVAEHDIPSKAKRVGQLIVR